MIGSVITFSETTQARRFGIFPEFAGRAPMHAMIWAVVSNAVDSVESRTSL